MGAGNSYEVKRYFYGKDVVSLISKIKGLARIKKRHTLESIKSVKVITRDEYIKGKGQELQNPHLFRVWGGYHCPICGRRFRDLLSFKRHIEVYGRSLVFAR